ncbi:HAD family phosphatase [Oculatella sp. LEGE 06141]|uniref:HAD family hydrolase n=1 Tax=Oculatella sp. LEGE 06141 TaxID=1828648 RepID=UPI001D151227|nr:beta-phosphoglucomutase family hydrolase [Oculatella sp. LEGE 06141]
MSQFDAALFDLDGVLTATAKIHAACWKRMFDDFLKQQAAKTQEPFEPFDIINDYNLYVDGKMRYVGVQSFLASRGMQLPYGDPADSPGYDTVCALGNFKDVYFDEVLHSQGIEVYEGSIALVHRLRHQRVKIAVVSSSHHCKAVLEAAGIEDCFDAIVDGNLSDQLHLAGKPAPDAFLLAAQQLGVEPSRAAVLEDAISGVQAGRAGQFGLVVGVDRAQNADALLQNGADRVVHDLSELL